MTNQSVLNVSVSTPQKAVVFFMPYISRQANRAMQRAMAIYPDVDMQVAQEKFKKVADAKNDDDRMKAFKEITLNEQDAIFGVQETMIKAMLDKVVLDNGEVLDESGFDWFLKRMDEEDFGNLGKVAGELVVNDRKKSKKKIMKS